MVGLGQKPGITPKIKTAFTDSFDNRGSGYVFAGMRRFRLQAVEKSHNCVSWWVGQGWLSNRKIHENREGSRQQRWQVSLELMANRPAVCGYMALRLGQQLATDIHRFESGIVRQPGIEPVQ